MNRKLHNSMTAAMTCSALLVIALLFSAPTEASVDLVPGMTAAAVEAGAADAVASAPRAGHAVARRSYQSVRMPFFSFFNPQG